MQQPRPSAPTPSNVDAHPTGPNDIDVDDSTQLYKVVNEDHDMRQNARHLLQESKEDDIVDHPQDQPMAYEDSPTGRLLWIMQVQGVDTLDVTRYVTQIRQARWARNRRSLRCTVKATSLT